MTTRPCVHPTCRDDDGNPRITQDTMCYPCRARYRKQLGWLVEDYVKLKTGMPQPERRAGVKIHMTRTSYGHPAEWASYMCSEIAELLADAEAAVRAHHGDGRPVTLLSEAAVVNHAVMYLSPRFDTLCTFDDAARIADEIVALHRECRFGMGLVRLTEPISMPCPSCDAASLTKDVGLITCSNCGREIPESEYPMLTRIALRWRLDDLVAAFDAEHAEEQNLTQKPNSVSI